MLDFIDKPINPPGPYRFTVITTFAGCGGSSLGYKWAGGKVLAAVEFEPNAIVTYRRNHTSTPVLGRDIVTVSVDELLALTSLKTGELDIFDGSPPCQGFSTAGKRVFADERNDLFKQYVRLLRGLRPRVFVMENVGGMVKGDMKHKFVQILTALKASGYRVRCQLLNAMWYGVPQSRERLIFIGVRDDLGLHPSYPAFVAKRIALRDALDGLTIAAQIAPVLTPLKVQRWRETPRGDVHHERFSLLRLAWDKPAPTILKTPGSGGHMHPDEPRLLNVAELRRIASFPDAFQFAGTWLQATERIGNTVPPRFMQAIAEHIYEHILSKT